MRNALVLLSLLWCYNLSASTIDLVFQKRVATALNGVTIYSDSAFETRTQSYFQEGQLLEIIDETEQEHEDDAQNQKFKWYKVQTEKGQVGWVFGDGIAVIQPETAVEEILKTYHKHEVRLSRGFEKAVMWIATVEGRDNLHQEDFLNPRYQEKYLVVTNDKGRSVHLNIGGINSRGKLLLRELRLHDITGDEIPEFIIQKSTLAENQALDHRDIEIYSLQSGVLSQLFEERMTLTYEDDIPSPALFKKIEVDRTILRVAYIDFVLCKNYKLETYDEQNPKRERCLEYVTYTYQWDDRNRRYRLIYEESRVIPKAGTRNDNVILRQEPSLLGKKIRTLQKNDALKVIKHYERFVLENDKSKVVPYLYVKLADGTTGYVLAKDVGFIETEHARVLGSYYQNPPMSKLDWKSDQKFLKIVPDDRSSYSGQ